MVEHDQRTCICAPDPAHPSGSLRGTNAGAVIPNKDCPIESHSLAGYRAAPRYSVKPPPPERLNECIPHLFTHVILEVKVLGYYKCQCGHMTFQATEYRP